MNGDKRVTPIVSLIRDQLRNVAFNEWLRELANPSAKHGDGGNKLRTYARFKKDVLFEPYLKELNDERKRALLMKFRIGLAPLRIETGRYERSGPSHANANGKGIPVHERVCMCCLQGRVEDEQHFLLVCPLYEEARRRMLDVWKSHCDQERLPNDLSVGRRDVLFVRLMECHEPSIIHEVAHFVWAAFKKREAHLLVPQTDM